VRRVVSYGLLAVCIFITYQSYVNSRQESGTEELAKRIACDVDSACILTHDRASQTRTDPFRRRYEFKTTIGSVLVTCKRGMIWLGAWKCTPERGGFLRY
jgi:hypothetical protein